MYWPLSWLNLCCSIEICCFNKPSMFLLLVLFTPSCGAASLPERCLSASGEICGFSVWSSHSGRGFGHLGLVWYGGLYIVGGVCAWGWGSSWPNGNIVNGFCDTGGCVEMTPRLQHSFLTKFSIPVKVLHAKPNDINVIFTHFICLVVVIKGIVSEWKNIKCFLRC